MLNFTQHTTWFDTKTGEVTQKSTVLSAFEEAGQERCIESNVIGIYPDYTFQTMEGFGCAMTETSCYLLSKMDAKTREDALRCWFGPGGMDAKFVRIHMDSCDYSLEEYQAVEDPVADPELETFSIKRDRLYIIPVMKEAMKLAGREISVLLSPWSPPAAWKTPPQRKKNDRVIYGGGEEEEMECRPSRCHGGHLKPEYYASWAKYLVKFVQAYLEEGIHVTMMSVQNEASAATDWDSCVWTGEEERTFLKEFLYPEMKAAHLTEKVGLYIWDHNKERMIEHIDEMMAGGIDDLIEGFAYHWYTGDHFEALSMLGHKYPDKILMHSESCGLHIPGKVSAHEMTPEQIAQLPAQWQEMLKKTPLEVDFDDAVNYAHDIIGDLNHGMNRWIDWNMIVDRTGGPRHVSGGFCAPLVAEEDGSYFKTISYHYLRQIAEAVQQGAVRIGTSGYCAEAEVTAVKNPDGTIGVVLLNRTEKVLPAVIRLNGSVCEFELPAHTLNTVAIQM